MTSDKRAEDPATPDCQEAGVTEHSQSTPDIVAELRAWDHCWPWAGAERKVAAAADEIERMRAEIVELRADMLGYQNALRAILGDPANTITAEHPRAK